MISTAQYEAFLNDPKARPVFLVILVLSSGPIYLGTQTVWTGPNDIPANTTFYGRLDGFNQSENINEALGGLVRVNNGSIVILNRDGKYDDVPSWKGSIQILHGDESWMVKDYWKFLNDGVVDKGPSRDDKKVSLKFKDSQIQLNRPSQPLRITQGPNYGNRMIDCWGDVRNVSLPLIGYEKHQAKVPVQLADKTKIKLATTASNINDFYNDLEIELTLGKGEGTTGKIIDYDGASRTATVDSEWSDDDHPDVSTEYEILWDFKYGMSGPVEQITSVWLSNKKEKTTSYIKSESTNPAFVKFRERPEGALTAYVKGIKHKGIYVSTAADVCKANMTRQVNITQGEPTLIGSNIIQLDRFASDVDGYYNSQSIILFNSDDTSETKTITGYDGSKRFVTLDSALSNTDLTDVIYQIDKTWDYGAYRDDIIDQDSIDLLNTQYPWDVEILAENSITALTLIDSVIKNLFVYMTENDDLKITLARIDAPAEIAELKITNGRTVGGQSVKELQVFWGFDVRYDRNFTVNTDPDNGSELQRTWLKKEYREKPIRRANVLNKYDEADIFHLTLPFRQLAAVNAITNHGFELLGVLRHEITIDALVGLRAKLGITVEYSDSRMNGGVSKNYRILNRVHSHLNSTKSKVWG